MQPVAEPDELEDFGTVVGAGAGAGTNAGASRDTGAGGRAVSC
jgi:hypothetical protein